MKDITGPSELWAVKNGKLVSLHEAGTDVRALIQGRVDLVAIASSMLAGAESEERGLNAAELSLDDSITAKITELSHREKRIQATKGAARDYADPQWDYGQGRLPDYPAATAPARPARGTRRSYESLFPGAAVNGGPFEAGDTVATKDAFWTAFLQRDQNHHPGLGELQVAQQSGVDSLGGVSVPTIVARGIVDVALESSIVMSRASIEPMTSEKKRVWAFDGSSVSGGTLYGNATAQWQAEGSTFTAVTLETKKVELTARKLGLFVEETREIAESGVGFSEELEARIGASMAWFADDAMLFGTGAGEPQGALTSSNPARIAVSRGGANLIAGSDIVSMVERLHPAMFDGAVWITSNTTLDQLTKAHLAGTNGDAFLFAPSPGGAIPNTLMGRPIIMSEKSPTLGTAADLSLVNFQGYVVGLRQAIQIDSSIHVGFMKDVVTLRGLARMDGQSRWLSAFQPKDSTSPTLSWCVTLAA